MSSRLTVRASSVLFALAAPVLVSTAAHAQWTATRLQPETATSSFAHGLGQQNQVGSVGFPERAVMWMGTASSMVDLHPSVAWDSGAFDVADGQQVGYVHLLGDGQTHACLWTGTAASWVDLHPVFAEYSVAQAADDGIQVGYASFGNGAVHASLWSGSAASWTDLHPAQQSSSIVSDASEGKLVGSVTQLSGLQHAAYWSSPQSAWVDLHPASAEFSDASGVRGDQQVGWTVTTNLQHAALWTGSAGSWIDLNPSWARFSRANATDGSRQVGGIAGALEQHACLWSGTADSAVDLHRFLPPGFRASEATDIWSDSGTIFVVGTAQRDYPDAGYEAILWSRPLAPQDRCVDATRIAQWLETDGAADDQLGHSAAISGDTAVLAAHRDDDGGSSSGSVYVYTRTQGFWVLQQKLTASDAAAGDEFGYSVAITGDTIVVGARNDDNAGGTDAGAAYVFVRAPGGTTWTEQQKIGATDRAGGDQFGCSVSIWSGYIVVGAQGDDDAGASSGSAYVFLRSGTTWSQQAKLTATDDAAGDQFGAAVAISRDTVIAGAFGEDTNPGNVNRGAAYVFLRTGTSWAQQAKLNASDAASNDLFGVSVAIEDDTAVIGANAADLPGASNAGAAYAFRRADAGFPPVPTWSQQQKLTASDAAASDAFGSSVAILDNRAVVGAVSDDTASGMDAGSAYIFDRAGTTWTQTQQLLPADPGASDGFGNAVTLSTTTVLIGASGDDTPDGASAGSGHVFTLNSGNWGQQARLTANGSAADPLPYFGGTVAIDGDIAAVSVIRRGDGGIGLQHGMAYVMERVNGIWVHTATLDPAEGLEGFAANEIIAIDVHGDTIVTGSAFATAAPLGDRTGAAFVYTRSPTGVWTLQQRLLAPDGAELDFFGASVSISNDTVVVGAPNDRVATPTSIDGSAYVFKRTGTSWSFEQRLTAPSPASDARFGHAVAISYDTIVVGEELRSTVSLYAAGAVYIFNRAPAANTWTLQAELTPPAPTAGLRLGSSVAIDRDTAVLGASGAAPGGMAFVYTRSGPIWSLQQELTPSAAAASGDFGETCAIDGDAIAIGDAADLGPGNSGGAAYIFARSFGGSVWSERARLELPDQSDYDWFGFSVALDQDLLLVGAPYDDNSFGADTGSVHFYQLDSAYSPAITAHPVSAAACVTGETSFSIAAAGTPPLTYQWQLETVPGSDIWINVTNGVMPGIGTFDISLPEVMVAVAITGGLSLTTRCVVTNDCGSSTSDEATLTVCAADFDCNGTREVPDIFAFLAAWFAGSSSADIDGVPGVAVPDIFAFLSAWFAGCD